MTPKQQAILDAAAKTVLKHEKILSGPPQYINPKKKAKKKITPKKKS